MTLARRPLAASIAFLAFAACLFGLAAQASAAPDRIKVGPDLYLQSADAATADAGAQRAEPSPPRSGRIVGGVAASISQYPWQAAVAYNPAVVPGNGYERQFCGGTLVSRTVVITAAHCLYDNTAPGFGPPSDFVSFTGRTTLSSTEGQEIGWSDYYFFTDAAGNPAFNPSTYDYDAVFVVLAGASSSPPVQVAGRNESAVWAAGQPAFISGWGDTASGAGAYQDSLLAARVQIIADSTCSNPASYGTDFHPELMFCAGVPSGGVDTCQGDSGGPIVVPIAGGGFRLVGDTSWGIGCGEAQYPGIYGRIAGGTTMGNALQAGIQSVTGENVYGSGAQPLAVPVISFTKKPKNKVKTKKKKAKVKFKFTSNEPSTAFTCQLDNKPPAACSSPYSKKVKTGKHTMTIAGANFIGDVGAPPATSSRSSARRSAGRAAGRRDLGSATAPLRCVCGRGSRQRGRGSAGRADPPGPDPARGLPLTRRSSRPR